MLAGTLRRRMTTSDERQPEPSEEMVAPGRLIQADQTHCGGAMACSAPCKPVTDEGSD